MAAARTARSLERWRHDLACRCVDRDALRGVHGRRAQRRGAVRADCGHGAGSVCLDEKPPAAERARQRQEPDQGVDACRRRRPGRSVAGIRARRRADDRHGHGRSSRRGRLRHLLHDCHRLPHADHAVSRRGRQAARDHQVHARIFRCVGAGDQPALRDIEGRDQNPLLHGREAGPHPRRQPSDPATWLRRLRGLADAGIQRRCRPLMADAGWRDIGECLRRGEHPRRRRIRSALAPGRTAREPPARVRGFRCGRRRPDRAQGHVAETPRHHGRQQRWPADGQHAHDVSATVRRGRVPGAAARHEALQPSARWRVVDG